MKKKEKAYDKGIEDGRKQMLDELMDAFYKNLQEETKKQVRQYVERQRFASGCDYKPKIAGYLVPK